MKRKITKILWVGLTLVLAVTLAVGMAAPVAAADYEENDWAKWGLSAIEPDTDIGPMGIAPGSTIIFAAVYDEEDDEWMVQKSEDEGYTWDDTELEELDSPIVHIAVSPNYEEDETVYVALLDGTVYCLKEAGDKSPIPLKVIPGVDELFSIDVWFDGDDNWIMAGTDQDAYMIRDAPPSDWIDQGLNAPVYQVNFAPDFDDSELIWAITQYWDTVDSQWEFLITSTASHGQWGQIIGEAEIDLAATQWVDLGFPDDYDSDPDSGDTILFAALSDGADNGDVYLIEGVAAADGDSNAIALFDLDGDPSADVMSIAVSGDTSDAVILAGALISPTVYRSDDGGDSWDDADKNPTGEGFTNISMALGAFDPDTGVAFVSTIGYESAVSRSDDGGDIWNQVGLIDTTIDGILDLGFHPDFPGEAVFLMITYSSGHDTYSLWLTENGNEEEIEDLNDFEEVNDIDFIRVLCGFVGSLPGNFDGEFELVEWAQDGEAIYIHGENEDGDSSIWKSTDDGQRFKNERSVRGNVRINDWVITDATTIYAATDVDGFYKTINSGLSWSSTTVGSPMNDIALQPGFDAGDSDNDNILLGSTDGKVFVSQSGGDSFEDTGASLTDDVYVAFDADYIDEDADGYKLIYACGEDDNIQVGEEDGKDTEWKDLKDDKGDGSPEYASCEGLVVADDNALYVIDDDQGDKELNRLLLHESNNLWESADDDDLDEAFAMWLTPGFNVVWVIDLDGAELWVLEDTWSGEVTLHSPPDGYRHDRGDTLRISWEETRGIDEDYEYEYTNVDPDVTLSGTTDDTSIFLTGLSDSSEYEWKVRVAPGQPWHSRWSSKWIFHTAPGPPPWAPELYAPGNGNDDVLMMPAFSWESAKTADSYQFVLADNPEFASPLVDKKVPESAFQPDIPLGHDITYYWKVQAFKGNKAISRWSEVSVFTTISEPAPPPPPPPVTVAPPAPPPAPIVLPTPIPPFLLWTIVSIGAALIIAVIVLIIRTKRVV